MAEFRLGVRQLCNRHWAIYHVSEFRVRVNERRGRDARVFPVRRRVLPITCDRERKREGGRGRRKREALALALSALIHSSIIDIGFARATLRRYRNVKLIRFARKRCIRRISITMLTDAKPEYYSSIVPSAGKERLIGSDLPAHNCFQIVG